MHLSVYALFLILVLFAESQSNLRMTPTDHADPTSTAAVSVKITFEMNRIEESLFRSHDSATQLGVTSMN